MGPVAMIPVAQGGGDVGLSEALVGAPVAVVVVALCLYGWRLLRTGVVVLGREHDEMKEDRDFWRKTAVRALNIGEAVTGRRGEDREIHGGGG